jgi:hypothetical protein
LLSLLILIKLISPQPDWRQGISNGISDAGMTLPEPPERAAALPERNGEKRGCQMVVLGVL